MSIVSIESARPERWFIHVREIERPHIFCGYDEDSQCWMGGIYARSLDELKDLMEKGSRAMQTARTQNRTVRIWV